MLRVHFTAEDLLDVRWASEPAPLLELALALAMVQRRDLDGHYLAWSRSVRASFPAVARPVLELVPPGGAVPSFLVSDSPGLEDALDRLQATGPQTVLGDLERVIAGGGRASALLSGLAVSDRSAWQVLDSGLRRAYRHVLSGSWQRVRDGFRGDVNWRSRLVAERGIRGALTVTLPESRWNGAALEIGGSARGEVWPGGRGLTLVPSMLWSAEPLVLRGCDGGLVLVHRTLTPLPHMLREPLVEEPLAAVLGRTRARILGELSTPQSTNALARALHVSAATASEHAGSLRRAGLVITFRDGRSVRHLCTALGCELLAANTTPAPRSKRGPDPGPDARTDTRSGSWVLPRPEQRRCPAVAAVQRLAAKRITPTSVNGGGPPGRVLAQ